MREPLGGTTSAQRFTSSPTSQPGDRPRSSYRMAGAVVLAWLGMYIHNVADLPHLTLLSPENAIPALVWVSLYVVWWSTPRRSWPAALLLTWGLVNLLGGFATVLPLPVWPFKPEQSLHHYLFHVLYALAQLPLLAVLHKDLRQARAHSSGAA